MISRERTTKTVSFVCAAGALLVGFASFYGWMMSIPMLVGSFARLPVIVPLTSLAIIFGAMSLFLRTQHANRTGRNPIVVALGVLVILAGLHSLLEFVLDRPLLFTRWLVGLFDSVEIMMPTEQPPYPAPNTAIAFVMFGGAIIELDKRPRFAQALLFSCLALSIVAMFQSGLRFSEVFQLSAAGPLVGMALPTAIGFSLLAVGTMASRPHDSWIELALLENSAGELLRRAILGSVLIPVSLIVAIVVIPGEDFKAITITYSLITISLIGGFAATIWSSALALSSLEKTRALADFELKERLRVQQRAERYQRILADASHALNAKTEFEEQVEVCVQIVVPEISDWAFVYIADEYGGLRIQAIRHVDADQESLLKRTLQGHSVHESRSGGVLDVLRTGKPIFIENFDMNDLPRVLDNENTRQALRRLGIRSYAVFPLFARERHLGAIVLATGPSGRHLTLEDLNLIEDLVARMALNLDNARLLAETRRAVKTREDIVSIVSHDLKNPLSTAKVFSQMIKDQGVGLGDSLKVIGSQLESSVTTMESLIKNILDMGKIARGLFEIDRRPESIVDLLREVSDVYAPLAAAKGIAFDTGVRCDEMVEVDRARLYQAISNLVSNAIKFTPTGGSVRVGASIHDGMMEIRVSDTGPGLDSSDLPHIFEQYYQAKETAKAGSGLGLFVARGVVEAHGGKISVKSAPGAGTTFTFTIPIREVSKRIENPPRESSAPTLFH